MPQGRRSLIRVVSAGWLVVLLPALVGAQQAARVAMSCFPADTQQVAYSNFAQLRSSADYPQIRQHVLSQQFGRFGWFLHSLGIDPEKDVDEVMLGWHGQTLGGPGSFGIATGRFEPDKARKFFTQNQLPEQSYSGLDLFAFGSGADPADTFFTFLDSSTAAFGRLHDLKALLDVMAGSGDALDTNQTFQSYEAELEGTGPQWGILTGKAAANVAVPWLSGGKKNTTDFTASLAPLLAVLYRVDWDGGFMAHISVVCKTQESAKGLFQLLNILKSTPLLPASGGAPGPTSVFQSLEASQEGSRLELNASGPADALDQLLKVGE